MSFLQLSILWALPLALLPVVIHLLNRLRYRTVNWGAMMFLERANRSSTRMNKVRQWLILLLRVLALAALVIGLARPLLGGWLGLSLAGPPDTVILLLDRSASMNARTASGDTRLEHVIKTAVRSAETFGKSSRFVLIDSASGKAAQIPSAAMLAELPAAAPTDTAANLPAMMAAALDHLGDNKTGSAEIWIASDLQASSWQAGNQEWANLEARTKALPSAPRIRLLAVDSPAAGDLSLSLVGSRSEVAGGKCRHELSFVIRKPAAEAEDKVLTLFDGTNRYPVKLKLSGTQGRYRHRFETELSDRPVLGFLELPADANSGNNTAYFGLGKPAPRQALVVGNPADLGVQIAQLACNPGNDPAAEAVVQTAGAFRPSDLRGASLLIWNAPEPSAEIRKQIETFAEEGGTLVLLPPADATAAAKWGDWLVWGEPETAKDGQPWRVAQWEHTDGPFADTDSGDALSLDKLSVGKRTAFSGKGIQLGQYADGHPFAMRFKSGAGSTIVLSTSLDPAWSNLGLGTVAVPMVQRLMDDGAKRLSASRQGVVGTTGPEAGAAVTRLLPAPEAGGFAQPRTRAGIYQAGALRLCLNRPESEDEPMALPLNEAASVMKSVSIQGFSDTAGDGGNTHAEIWKYLLLAMLAMLAAEAFLITPANPAGRKGKGE